MIDQHSAQVHRARLEEAARELGPGERLWFEVRSVKRTRAGGRWKAAIGTPEQVGRVFSGKSWEGAVVELDYPSQLPGWLEAMAVRTLAPVPLDWGNLVFFGCDLELGEPNAATNETPRIERGDSL